MDGAKGIGDGELGSVSVKADEHAVVSDQGFGLEIIFHQPGENDRAVLPERVENQVIVRGLADFVMRGEGDFEVLEILVIAGVHLQKRSSEFRAGAHALRYFRLRERMPQVFQHHAE